MAIATLWERGTSRQAADGTGHLAELDHPRKGSFGGQCFHITCRSTAARWYNKLDGRYYCESCAEAINAECAQRGELLDCSKHV